MTDNNQPNVNNDLIERQKKWKKIERITLAIDLIWLFVFFILSFTYQCVQFNSIVYFVLAVILSVVMASDLVMMFISWCKLYRIDSLIERQEEDSTDTDNVC